MTTQLVGDDYRKVLGRSTWFAIHAYAYALATRDRYDGLRDVSDFLDWYCLTLSGYPCHTCAYNARRLHLCDRMRTLYDKAPVHRDSKHIALEMLVETCYAHALVTSQLDDPSRVSETSFEWLLFLRKKPSHEQILEKVRLELFSFDET
jgi:hypothetical protein